MARKFQRNWLLILTGCLFGASVLMVVATAQDYLDIRKCSYGEELFSSGELLPEYEGKYSCYCSSEGKVVCEDETALLNRKPLESEDFTSSNLVFSTSFQNYIESVTPGIRFTKIVHGLSSVSVSIERAVMCTSTQDAPVQIGYYKMNDKELILTAMTNQAPSLYTQPCIVEDTFEFYDLNVQFPESFQVMYQTEENEIYGSNNCVYEGYLQNDGDTYQSGDSCEVCSCKDGVNICTNSCD